MEPTQSRADGNRARQAVERMAKVRAMRIPHSAIRNYLQPHFHLAGMVGHDFFKPFEVTFDFSNMQIFLQ
jgi:hypothetical protein